MPRDASAAARPSTKNRVGLSTAIVRTIVLPPAAIEPRTERWVVKGSRMRSRRGTDPAAAVVTWLPISKMFAGGTRSTRAASPAFRPGAIATPTTFSL